MSTAVTAGHWRSLELLERTDDARSLIDRFDERLPVGRIHLRPTSAGLQPIVLDPATSKFIGAGGPLTALDLDDASLDAAVSDFARKSEQAVGSKPEEQFSMGLVSAALDSALRLPTSELRLVAHEWRLASGARIDLLGFDPATSDLVVVELKASASSEDDAVEQARGYVESLRSDRGELVPYFERLLLAMKALFGSHDSALTRWSRPLGGVRAEVWWPGGSTVVAEPPRPDAHPVRSDDPFVARLRREQAQWRAATLRVEPGVGPQAASDRVVSSMLEPIDGALGRNFVSRAGWRAAERRVAEHAGGVDPYRCRHNLLSSQPMAFNFFGPLVEDLDAASAVLRQVLDDDALDVTDVRVEYAPEPAGEYLDDRTAFDVFVEHVDGSGERGFVGIETKFSERFSQREYDSERYRALTERAGSPWASSPPELADQRWNQLWRNHLLVEAVRTHPDAPHGTNGKLLVVHHPDDPSMGEAFARYRRFLRNDHDPLVLDLGDLIRCLRRAELGPGATRWIDDLERRYLPGTPFRDSLL